MNLNINLKDYLYNYQISITLNPDIFLFLNIISFLKKISNHKTPMIFQNLMKKDYQEFCIKGNMYFA
jgi:hypothetical protein